MGVGILSPEEIRKQLLPEGMKHHFVRRPSSEPVSLDLSSMDLPLGDKYWLMKGSCRCGADLTVADLTQHFADGKPKKLEDGTILEKGRVYLVQLDCRLDLSGSRVRGKATGKSSIGRLDVLVRLLMDGGKEFDVVPEDSVGDLYVEVTPISFDLQVSPGTCLSQLRLFRGPEDLFTLTMDELKYEDPFPVVDAHGDPVTEDCEGRGTTFAFSLDLDPDPTNGCSGFVAKRKPPDEIDPSRKGYYNPTDYWDPVVVPRGEGLHLETNRLYILRSKERLRLPGHLAVECQTYTETLGEWRIEYAGFAHPWFGYSRSNGTPIIFEVRGHNIPTILRDRLPLGKVSFRRMSLAADRPKEAHQYETQELKLSSCFGPWGA
jgi:dCTP deaminase